MKAVILAGGRGTRISEETVARPKPLVEIGDMPILWHILKIYSHHGINDFVICLGYKGAMIKQFFLEYAYQTSDLSVDLAENAVNFHSRRAEPWKVTLVDTGLDTATGGRLKRIRPYVADDEAFLMTYGDGLADVDVTASLAHHRAMGLLATMTVVRPPARFGSAAISGGRVERFIEKPQAEEGLINGGFFVMSPKALDYVADDATSWEFGSLPRIAAAGQLAAFQHDGFWQPMDTLREKDYLQGLFDRGEAPWMVWRGTNDGPA
ncbi:glucose-1-phosphate cytidylyltransferase [Caenispirillum salinarum]|uniref:glucose-1-phosphate cytidylyltransferase n=1 Tax=Caenispirillum salinarum TaxID=859058 RepID=UPI00384F978F